MHHSRGMKAVSSLLLVLFGLILPFEAPLFRVGPLQITTSELVLYALLATWGIAVSLDFLRADRPWLGALSFLRSDSMALAALSWFAAMFASAVSAPSYRAAALKFVLRSLSGVLVYFASRTLLRTAQAARPVIVALVAGALASAATAVVESAAPASMAILRPFHATSFETLGLVRASGVFGYPTMGAMYWEATVPLLVALPYVGPRSAREVVGGRGILAVALASTLLVWAILASGTRSSLAGVAVGCSALLALGWHSGKNVRVSAGVVLLVLGVFSGSALRGAGKGAAAGQRLLFWHDERLLRVEYSVDSAVRSVGAAEVFFVPVALRNTGTRGWPSAGDHPTRLAYHLERLDRSGGVLHAASENLASPSTLVVFEGRRTALPADVPPGGTSSVLGVVESPKEDGTYLLRWDLVQEGVAWFGDQGNASPAQQIEVTRRTASQEPTGGAVVRPTLDPPPPARSVLWRAAVALWRGRPLLGVGPDNFRRRYEAVLSPGPAGEIYQDQRIHANSLYLETLADVGAVGAGALAWLGFVLARSLKRQSASRNVAGLGCAVGAAAFFVHGGFDYFFEFTPLFGLFWLLLGLANACDSPPDPTPVPLGTPR